MGLFYWGFKNNYLESVYRLNYIAATDYGCFEQTQSLWLE